MIIAILCYKMSELLANFGFKSFGGVRFIELSIMIIAILCYKMSKLPANFGFKSFGGVRFDLGI